MQSAARLEAFSVEEAADAVHGAGNGRLAIWSEGDGGHHVSNIGAIYSGSIGDAP